MQAEKPPPQSQSQGELTERQGVEPLGNLRTQQSSSPPRSATPAPLRMVRAERIHSHAVFGEMEQSFVTSPLTTHAFDRKGQIRPIHTPLLFLGLGSFVKLSHNGNATDTLAM